MTITEHEISIDPAVEEIAQELLTNVRIPSATYRLQFNKDFTFRDALALVPYLAKLGISECYASPILKATPGSNHGYDVTDPTQLNPELGTQEDFKALSAALREHGMGLIVDVVPNHMGIGDPGNSWWMDVLENGPGSIYAGFFDINWHPVKAELENQVLLPILGDQYGTVLESGQLRLRYEEGSFWVEYYQHRLPVAPRTYSLILTTQLEELEATLDKDNEHLQEYQSILTALGYLPPRTDKDPERVEERYREKSIIKRRIAQLYTTSSEVRAAIDRAVELLNGKPGDPASFDLLDQLIASQAYRLAFWRVATEEINYRRFFDINTLAAIRMGRPEVFEATHELVLNLLADGHAHGLRIDHPDGLWDPPAYFLRLQEGYTRAKVLQRLGVDEQQRDQVVAQVHSWLSNRLEQSRGNQHGASRWPLYVVAEKILSDREPLPTDWAVHGTTGYDALNIINGIFIDTRNERAFDRIYSSFSGQRGSFANLTNRTKKQIMLISLASEINALSHQLNGISEANRRYRDFTLNSLTFALREVIASLGVYRTYINARTGEVPERDQRFVEAAVADAKRRNRGTAESLFDFVRDTLLLRNLQDFREQDREEVVDWVMKFQQLTGPVMAKGVEDTAFYIYNRLVSINEVGGHPEHFGLPLVDFHRRNKQRQQQWPHALSASSTHDTKRSEDVRARINVLSEIPDEWRAAITRWSRLNAGKKTEIGDTQAPDRNDEYLLYQVILGAWPNGGTDSPEFDEFRERIASYMEKATKEAKVYTSWINPNEAYDSANRKFALAVLENKSKNRFLHELAPLARKVAFCGQFNALAQQLLKLTAPGVPDIYRGTELWDLSLVDPDNRRPVDFKLRQRLLDELASRVEQGQQDESGALVALAGELLQQSEDGRIKLYVTHRALLCRRDNQDLFKHGSYQPLEAQGVRREHVCAFIRRLEQQAVISVVPRLIAGLIGDEEQPPVGESVWGDTWLPLPDEQPGTRYRNIFTGELLELEQRDGGVGLALSATLQHFPVALLERVG